jgi:hypothetical protein
MNSRRGSRWGLLLLSAALIGVSLAPPAMSAPRGGIKAVVVRSWSGCSSNGVFWADLNANWSNYGSIPVTIDYTDFSLCTGTITYDALVASGADVVIVSDPAGIPTQYSREEGEAIRQYAREGHNVLGTYAVFGFANVDNSFLGPIFGISAKNDYNKSEEPLSASYQVRFPDDPLFRNVPDPYVSSGYQFSQVPVDGHWRTDDMFGGAGVALADHSRGTIVLYRAPTYDAIYISNFPEYGGSTIDEQWYYNALIYPATG